MISTCGNIIPSYTHYIGFKDKNMTITKKWDPFIDAHIIEIHSPANLEELYEFGFSKEIQS